MGSRHLQALKSVKNQLNILVIDPNPQSLKIARERYDASAGGGGEHILTLQQEMTAVEGTVDLAIIATNSNIRKEALEKLLKNNKVKYIILEKLLFDKYEDYDHAGQLLDQSGAAVWVNCSMRQMPFYRNMKAATSGKAIIYRVTGSQYGLVTNAIHYIDHLAYLTDCTDYEVDISGLDPKPIASKRPGFLELNGNLQVRFANGSHGTFFCLPDGNMPAQVEIYTSDFRCISRESEGKAWLSDKNNDWQWREVEARVPYQSQMTKDLVEEIISAGTCPLVQYQESKKLHLILLEALKSHLNKYGNEKYDHYPFT